MRMRARLYAYPAAAKTSQHPLTLLLMLAGGGGGGGNAGDPAVKIFTAPTSIQ